MSLVNMVLVQRDIDCDGAGWSFYRVKVQHIIAMGLELAIHAHAAKLNEQTEKVLKLIGDNEVAARAYKGELHAQAKSLASYNPEVKLALYEVGVAEERVRQWLRESDLSPHIWPSLDECWPMLEPDFEREFGHMLNSGNRQNLSGPHCFTSVFFAR